MHRVPEAFWDEFRKVSYRVYCSRLQRGGSSEILVELWHRIQKSDHQPAHFVTYIYVLHRKKSRRTFNKMLIILSLRAVISPKKMLKDIQKKTMDIKVEETKIYCLKSHHHRMAPEHLLSGQFKWKCTVSVKYTLISKTQYKKNVKHLNNF